MPTENTSLKNITPTGDSNTTHEMVIEKSNTNHRTFLIVAGSLLALLVLIAATGTSGSHHLQSSAHEIATGKEKKKGKFEGAKEKKKGKFEGAVALADYQVDSANEALNKDNFGVDTSELDENTGEGSKLKIDPFHGFCSRCVVLGEGHCDGIGSCEEGYCCCFNGCGKWCC